jgi:hypothetical protein
VKFFFDNHLAPKLAHGLNHPDLIKTARRAERGSAFLVTVNGKIDPLK